MKEPEKFKIEKPNLFTFLKMVLFNFYTSFFLFSSTLVASISMIFLYGHQGIAVMTVKAILAGVSIFVKVFPIQKLLRQIRQYQGEEGDGEKKPVPLFLVAIIGIDVSGMIYIYYILESPEFFLTVLGGWIILAIFLALTAYRGLVSYYQRTLEEDFETQEEDDDDNPFKYGRR
ncbi:MAG: hypothetical protein KKH92_10010 [Firmicutes bacterium]|nr:hypothetical protein [Bacillota bacterium]